MSDGIGGASAATGAPPTPTTSRPMLSTGQTPLAKRAATLSAMAGNGTAGPVMASADANVFMYALHSKVEALEKWAVTVQESITDHAEHIDLTRSRAAHSFQTVSDEINRIRAWSQQASRTQER